MFRRYLFLFVILANRVNDKSCTEKSVPISPKGPSLWRKQVFVYIDEDFAIN